MKVGVFITNQQTIATDMVRALDEQIVMVRHARDHGWDSVLTGQHYLNEGDNQQLQPVPFLARLAAESGDMRLGTGILLLNLHNPVYMAETIASLDVITGGRFIFGVGLGYREMEFDAFGMHKGGRVKAFEDSLALMQRLWTEDSVSHDGPGCRLDKVRMNIRPVQKPRPPIWIAANNDPAVRRAARLGDAWFINPHSTIDVIERQMAVYREERRAAGLPEKVEVPVFREMYCARSRAQALEVAGQHLAEKYRGYASWGQDKAMPGFEDFRGSMEHLMQGRFILGTPDECHDQIEAYAKTCGVDHLVLRTHWAGMPMTDALASMQLISDQLLPALRKL